MNDPFSFFTEQLCLPITQLTKTVNTPLEKTEQTVLPVNEQAQQMNEAFLALTNEFTQYLQQIQAFHQIKNNENN